ncbi:MAG: helix-turn-helix domain-containing protein [Candidatus Bilamarchaeaceae archaeon]
MLNEFFRIKPCKIILLLREEKEGEKRKYISELARQSGSTYVHATNLIKKLERVGLVKTEKKGREKIVTLTEEGLKVANAISDAVSRLSAITPPSQQQNKH